MCFNPRARGGRDTHANTNGDEAHAFQSTRPRGARLLNKVEAEAWISFNPRARGGRDTKRIVYSSRFYVSIHAPAGGATT